MTASSARNRAYENMGPEVMSKLREIITLIDNRSLNGHFSIETKVNENLVERITAHLELGGYSVQKTYYLPDQNAYTIRISWSK